MRKLNSLVYEKLETPIYEEVVTTNLKHSNYREFVACCKEDMVAVAEGVFDEEGAYVSYEVAHIEQIIYLDNKDYTYLNNNYMKDLSILFKKYHIEGGHYRISKNEYRNIYCKVINKETGECIYINPEGYDYIRYMAVEPIVLNVIHKEFLEELDLFGIEELKKSIDDSWC